LDSGVIFQFRRRGECVGLRRRRGYVGFRKRGGPAEFKGDGRDVIDSEGQKNLWDSK
jgi:hypothetical protein